VGEPLEPIKKLSYAQAAKKSLGQNFLVDPNIALKIIRCLELRPQDRVLEIGPGQGALSFKILDMNSRLAVIEKDFNLAQYLKACAPEINVMVMDALNFAWHKLAPDYSWKLIGNLPYNIASPLIWSLLEAGNLFKKAVFTVQKEVAQRMVSNPGSKKYGALSVWVQSFAIPKLEFSIGPQVFRPRPKVDSAVISLEPLPRVQQVVHPQKLSNLLHLCFQQRRKQLGNILKQRWTPAMSRCIDMQGLDLQIRPEQLTPQQFQELSLVVD
jgi:16S rRNA (adenine1518-N6/adenine1519-N6)-dimethyltransferase